MLDSLPSPEVSYLFKRQLLTHHSYESQIPANRLRFAENESPSRVIGPPRMGNTVRIDVEGNVFHVGAATVTLAPNCTRYR
jgi:hypothetical protein